MQPSWGSPKLAALRYVIPREVSRKSMGVAELLHGERDL